MKPQLVRLKPGRLLQIGQPTNRLVINLGAEDFAYICEKASELSLSKSDLIRALIMESRLPNSAIDRLNEGIGSKQNISNESLVVQSKTLAEEYAQEAKEKEQRTGNVKSYRDQIIELNKQRIANGMPTIPVPSEE
jgi:hypothetical protein